FHQTLLDYVSHQPALMLGRDRAQSAQLALLAFHAAYVEEHRDDDAAIDRCVENILATLDWAWGLRYQGSCPDVMICSVVRGLGNYFHRRGHWRIGQLWLENAIELLRSSEPVDSRVPLAHALHQLAVLLFRLGNYNEARRLLDETISLNK